MKNNRIISFFLVSLPVFSIYQSPISFLSLADIGLLVLSSMILYNEIINIKVRKYSFISFKDYIHLGPIALIIFMVFLTMLSILINKEFILADVVVRILRYGLFMFTVSIVGQKYFVFDFAARYLINISVISTIYIIIQTLSFYVYGKVLPFLVPFLEPMVIEYKDISGLVNWYNQFYYRPQSFFMEPAHFSQYVLIALALCLFWNNYQGKKSRYYYALFLSAGLILSTSSIGVLIGMFIWACYGFKTYLGLLPRQKFKLVLIMFVCVIIMVPIIIKFDWLTEPITRVFQTSVRTTDSFRLFTDLSFQNKLFGVGLGNEDTFISNNGRIPFINSITIILLSGGYFAIVAFFLLFLSLIIKNNTFTRVLSISLFILSFGSEIFFTYTGIVWLLFIYYNYSDYNEISKI